MGADSLTAFSLDMPLSQEYETLNQNSSKNRCLTKKYIQR